MSGRGRAPGKLILSGEHAVVHGHHAVAAAIDMWIDVRLYACSGPFQSNLTDSRVAKGLTTVLPKEGISANIESGMPIGRGLGSSAALSIATLRAWSDFKKTKCSFENLYRDGFKMERVFHGNPSGVDHAVSALECGLIYQKQGPKLEPIKLPEMTLVIMDCGRSSDTSAMVEKAAKAPKHLFEKIGDCTMEIIAKLKEKDVGHALGVLLTKNHRLLQQIGVSDPDLDMMVEAALNAGAMGAKLAGAGGGGVAFALTSNPVPIHKAIANIGFKSYAVNTLSETR